MIRLLTLLVISMTCAAHAETAEDAKKQLSGTLSELKSSSKKQKELEDKQAKLERELITLQQETIDLAQDVKKQEEALFALEEKTDILEDQKKEKTAALETRRAELSETLSAMVKLSKLPPEAVIAMPGKLQETLSAARALGIITKAVDDEANSLKAQLHELDALEQKIKKNREVLLQKKADFSVRHKRLIEKVRERGKIHTALSGKSKEEKERMTRLTDKSKTLQDLVDTLGRAESSSDMQDRHPSPASVRTHTPLYKAEKQRKTRSFIQAKGKLRLPSTGRIVALYGHLEAGAAFSKGVMIETREFAGVVAPYDGEVVYAGVFRDYGKMVIIRHSGDYHTLVSGMQEINCAPGQFMLEGEPIGAMGKPSAEGKSHLYVEMRKGGKPIDPMTWFKG